MSGLLVWVPFAFILLLIWAVVLTARNKGRNPIGWAVASLFISPIVALFVLACLKSLRGTPFACGTRVLKPH
jgi:hypothetical protein